MTGTLSKICFQTSDTYTMFEQQHCWLSQFQEYKLQRLVSNRDQEPTKVPKIAGYTLQLKWSFSSHLSDCLWILLGAAYYLWAEEILFFTSSSKAKKPKERKIHTTKKECHYNYLWKEGKSAKKRLCTSGFSLINHPFKLPAWKTSQTVLKSFVPVRGLTVEANHSLTHFLA